MVKVIAGSQRGIHDRVFGAELFVCGKSPSLYMGI
jgi:hypothetical protein